MRFHNRLVATLLVLLLAGCSSTTFVYNRLDFIIPWYVGKYVDLDRAQKKQLDELLIPFLQWHRREELPAYLEWVERLEPQLEKPLTPQQLAAAGEQIQQAWTRIEARGLEWMITLGETLSDEQLAGFMDELWEKQQEYEEEDLARDDAEYREEARENLEEQIEDFLGQINDSQEAMLDKATARLWRADKTWLQERARWLERLGQVLQRQPGWQDELRRAVTLRENYNSEAYLATYEHNASVLYAVIAEVLNSRTADQDRHLRRELESLQEDLTTLRDDRRLAPENTPPG